MKGLKKDRTEKEEKIRQPYTKTTAVVQVLMTMLAALFLAPLFIIVNYSFKTKKELYINSPLSLPQSFQLDNYVKAIDKLNMGTTYINTFIYTAVSVFVLAMLCGITAWAIARCKHRFFKFCYIYFIVGILIPYQALFLPIYTIGFKMHLTNTRFGIIFMYVATGISFGVFLMNSFMSTVPVELEEAARIDGASKPRMFFKITLPMITSIAFFNIIMQLITALQNFTSAFVVTNGGPNKATYVLGMKLYTDAFKYFKMGYACATSWILFMVILVMTIILFVTSKKWVYYDN